MFLGRGTTSSVIHAAGEPVPGVSARPKALVVLVKINRSTPAATDSSSRFSVAVTLASMKAWRVWEPTCGLCNVAVCTTAPTPSTARRATARSARSPTTRVYGPGSRSTPTACSPRTRISPSPRCPELPVTRTVIRISESHGPSERRGLAAGADVQLAQDVRDVELDRVHGDRQLAGDLAVAPAGGQLLQHLTLPDVEHGQWIGRGRLAAQRRERQFDRHRRAPTGCRVDPQRAAERGHPL